MDNLANNLGLPEVSNKITKPDLGNVLVWFVRRASRRMCPFWYFKGHQTGVHNGILNLHLNIFMLLLKVYLLILILKFVKNILKRHFIITFKDFGNYNGIFCCNQFLMTTEYYIDMALFNIFL